MARCGGGWVKLSIGNCASWIPTAQCQYKLQWCFLPHVSFGHGLGHYFWKPQSGSLAIPWAKQCPFEPCSIRVSFSSLKLRTLMDTLFFQENILSTRFLPGTFASSSGIINGNVKKNKEHDNVDHIWFSLCLTWKFSTRLLNACMWPYSNVGMRWEVVAETTKIHKPNSIALI